MSEVIEQTIEINVEASPKDADRIAESCIKMINTLTIEQFEAVASFVDENPDSVTRIENLLINPPAWAQAIINRFS